MIYHTAAALLASGLVASVCATDLHQHHQHLHKKDYSVPASVSTANSTCGCTTYTTTWYGAAGLVQDKPTPTSSTSSSTSTSTSTSTSSSTSTSTSTSSSSSSSSSSWVAPTTSSETPSSTWVAPTTSSETPSSTWEAPTTSWTPETTSSAAPSSSDAPSSAANNVVNALLPSISVPGLSSPSQSSSSSGSGNTGSISVNGNKWAMTYTPYNNDGSCKSAGDVSSDIASIASKGFTTVRIYATDCSGPQNVGSACKANGLKIILGIYIDGSGISDNAYSQVSTLTSWGSGQWDMVEMVVVGNEAIFNGFCTASALASFINDVKGQFQSAGYSGPVTTTEPLGTIQQYASTLCPVVDVAAANIHPFFNGAITAVNAGTFVSSQLGDLKSACGGSKEAYNLETGWPWNGDANGDAIASSAEQAIAIAAIVLEAGSKSAIFSFENDGWKAPGDLRVEQYWGCADLFS